MRGEVGVATRGERNAMGGDSARAVSGGDLVLREQIELRDGSQLAWYGLGERLVVVVDGYVVVNLRELVSVTERRQNGSKPD